MYLTKVMTALQYPATLKVDILSSTFFPEISMKNIVKTKIHSATSKAIGHH